MKFDLSKVKTIDLSHRVIPLKDPVSPDDIAEAVATEGLVWPLFEYGSYVDNSIAQVVKLKTHVKTHIESPWHLNHAGKCMSDYTPDRFFGRAVNMYFDVEPGTLITREMAEKVDNGRLRKGDIVIVHTSCDESLHESEFSSKIDFPMISNGFAEYVIEKGIKLWGQDNSINVGYWEDYNGRRCRAHDLMLENDIPLLEMMTNLDALTQDTVLLLAIPGLMKFEGIDASPCVAVALEGFELL
ncbi:MAG: cyclase family protein [Eubacteriales bacterium]|nr:cyclase family protein [Eubacteriales bacterium]